MTNVIAVPRAGTALRALRAVGEDTLETARLVHELASRPANRPEPFAHRFGDELFQHHGATVSHPRGEKLGMLTTAERGEQQQVRDLGPPTGLIVIRRSESVFARTRRRAVSSSLAPSALAFFRLFSSRAVHPKKEQHRTKKGPWQGEGGLPGGVAVVAATGKRVGEVEMRELILPDREEIRATGQDVGRRCTGR